MIGACQDSALALRSLWKSQSWIIEIHNPERFIQSMIDLLWVGFELATFRSRLELWTQSTNHDWYVLYKIWSFLVVFQLTRVFKLVCVTNVIAQDLGRSRTMLNQSLLLIATHSTWSIQPIRQTRWSTVFQTSYCCWPFNCLEWTNQGIIVEISQGLQNH